VVSTYPSEKYELVNGKDDIPYMKWKIKAMFQSKPPASNGLGLGKCCPEPSGNMSYRGFPQMFHETNDGQDRFEKNKWPKHVETRN